MLLLGLLAVAAAAAVAYAGWRMLVRPERILYALAFVVSFVGVNWHIGVTLYFSRLLVAYFLLVLLIRSLLQRRDGLRVRCDWRLLVLFAGTIAVQFISAYESERFADSVRQMFIYMGAMAVFVTVLSLGDTSAKIIRALRFYIAAGIAQGLYGIYQVVGGPNKWPTYQTLLDFIPTANDRTNGGGYYFTNGYDVYRALGFFPGDVSHYAGYLAGVLLIALAFIAYGRRTALPYVVVVIAGIGLVLSLSRSGIVAFAGIGLPILAYFLSSRHIVSIRKLFRMAVKPAAALAVVGLLAGVFGGDLMAKVDIGKVVNVLGARMMNLVQSDDSPQFESMALHLRTRMLALDAFASSPLIGVGLGITATPWYSEKYQEPWLGAHSHHFNILGETGILGALLEWTFMAIVFLQMLHGLWATRARSLEQAAMIGLLSAYVTILIGNFFYAYYTNDFVWFLMGAGWALSVAVIREARQRQSMTRTVAAAAPQALAR